MLRSCCALLLLLPLYARAQTIYPQSSVTRYGDAYTIYPFSVSTIRLQQVAAEAKGNRGTYHAISFRRNARTYLQTGVPRTVELELRMGGADFGRFQSRFAANWATGPALVVARRKVSLPDWRQRPSKGPAKFDARIVFDRPFAHDGKWALLWEITVHSNTSTAAYPADLAGKGESFTGGTYRTLQNGCATNTGKGAVLGFTVDADFRTTGRTSELLFLTARAPARAPVAVVVGLSDPRFSVPGLCAPLRASPDALIGLGVADAQGFVVPVFFGAGAWNPTWKDLVLYTQGLAPDPTQGDLPIALSTAGRLQLPGRPPVGPVVRRIYAFSLGAATGGGPYEGGAVIRLD